LDERRFVFQQFVGAEIVLVEHLCVGSGQRHRADQPQEPQGSNRSFHRLLFPPSVDLVEKVMPKPVPSPFPRSRTASALPRVIGQRALTSTEFLIDRPYSSSESEQFFVCRGF